MTISRSEALLLVRKKYGMSGSVRVTQGKGRRGYGRYQVMLKDSIYYRIAGHGNSWEEALESAGVER